MNLDFFEHFINGCTHFIYDQIIGSTSKRHRAMVKPERLALPIFKPVLSRQRINVVLFSQPELKLIHYIFFKTVDG